MNKGDLRARPIYHRLHNRIDVISDLMNNLPNDDKKADRMQALAVARCVVSDDRDRVVTLEDWISSFDNGDCGGLSQMEQLEIRSLLLELKYYRDKALKPMPERMEYIGAPCNNEECPAYDWITGQCEINCNCQLVKERGNDE